MGFSEDEIKEYQELYEAFSQDKEGNDRGTSRLETNRVLSLSSLLFLHCDFLFSFFPGYIESKDFREYVRMIGGNPSEKKLDEWVKKVRGVDRSC